MRALVKRLADRGLTVLLSSHDMGEVEEICDNVTIMRNGSVVFHGEISELREQAPEQGHRLATDDDARALQLAARHPRLRVAAGADGTLSLIGAQTDVDAYVTTLVGSGIALRRLELTETPLEALFFMLTESSTDTVPSQLLAQDRAAHQEATR
jgi:ABC-2 type transport system ATP-binding protein